MAHGAVAGRGVGDDAGLLARGLQIVAQRLVRAFRPRHQHERRGRDLRDRREVLDRIKAHVLVQARIDGHDAGLRHHEGIAVRLGARRGVQRQVAARARLVLDHDVPARVLRDGRPDHAGQGVGSTARGKRGNQRNGRGAHVGRAGRGARGQQRGCQHSLQGFHCLPH
ncbi:hypothetical protein G6F68_012631 [Rhizopus microsporus]|nr:hypothetical protein G6F68_012631 [Rhizopus microsporus]